VKSETNILLPTSGFWVKDGVKMGHGGRRWRTNKRELSIVGPRRSKISGLTQAVPGGFYIQVEIRFLSHTSIQLLAENLPEHYQTPYSPKSYI